LFAFKRINTRGGGEEEGREKEMVLFFLMYIESFCTLFISKQGQLPLHGV